MTITSEYFLYISRSNKCFLPLFYAFRLRWISFTNYLKYSLHFYYKIYVLGTKEQSVPSLMVTSFFFHCRLSKSAVPSERYSCSCLILREKFSFIFLTIFKNLQRLVKILHIIPEKENVTIFLFFFLSFFFHQLYFA